MLACALGAALAAYPALRAARAVDAVGVLAAAAVAAVVFALASDARLLPLPLLLLAAEVELHHVLEPLPRAALVVYAAALLLLGELIAWSRSLRTTAAVDRGVVVARSTFLAGAVAGATALGAAVSAASTVRLTSSLGDAAIGTAAAVFVLSAISIGARRSC